MPTFVDSRIETPTDKTTGQPVLSHSAISVLQRMREGVVLVDDAGRCTWANDRLLELLPDLTHPVEGQRVDELLGADFVERIAALFTGRADREEEVHETFRLGDGRLLTLRAFSERTGWMVLVDEARAESENEVLVREQLIVESVVEAVLGTDADGRVTRWNAAAERVFGYPAAEILGQPVDILSGDGAGYSAREIFESLEQDGQWSGELVLRHRDGSDRIVEATILAMLDSRGGLAGTASLNRDVTRQRQSEVELEAFFGAMSDPVFVIDRDGRHERVVSVGSANLYVDRDRIVGRTIHDLMPDAVADRLHGIVIEALDSRSNVEVAYSLQFPTGDRRFHANVSPIDSDRVIWVARDITDHYNATEQLRVNKEQLQTFLNTIPDHAWMKDREGRYLLANDAYLTAWDRSASEVAGRRDSDLFPESLARGFAATDEQVMRLGQRTAFEHHVATAEGGPSWWEVIKAPLIDSEGEVAGIVGISRDVTERKRTEAILRESEARFAQLAENIPQAFWIVDRPLGEVVFASPAVEKIWGFPPEEVVSDLERWANAVHPADRTRVRSVFEAGMAAGEPYEQTYRIIREDGEVRWVHDRGFPVADAEGRIYRYAGVAEDITDQRRVEREMQRQALLFRATNEGVIYTDLRGRITEWNPGAEKVFGYDADEAVGMSIQELMLPGRRPGPGTEYLRTLRHDQVWLGEETAVRKNGTTAECEIAILPVFSGHQLDGAIVIARDISERRSLEEQLRQSQKLEGIGRLAGGIAHDFNNMLLVIQGFVSMLEEEISAEGEAAEYLGEIRDATDRSARLTSQLLAYSRRQIMRTEVIDLNEATEALESMLRSMIGEAVQLTTELDPQLARVEADRSQLEQVLVNLVVNSRDAMPDGGRITLRTRDRVAQWSNQDGFPINVAPGRYAEIVVEDTGVGMSAEVLESAFEPFFTTKPAGEGTGLGLSTVYGIVKQLGGHVWVESRPGQGSRFHLLLPAAPNPAASSTDSGVDPPRAEPHARGGTVLVVEDEPAVRRLLALLLQRAGYRVLTAATGSEAARAVDAHDGDIDVALIDVVLRGESGRTVAEDVRNKRPSTEVVFMSGYTDDSLIRHGIRESEQHFLQKPIQPEVLIETLRRLTGNEGKRLRHV